MWFASLVWFGSFLIVDPLVGCTSLRRMDDAFWARHARWSSFFRNSQLSNSSFQIPRFKDLYDRPWTKKTTTTMTHGAAALITKVCSTVSHQFCCLSVRVLRTSMFSQRTGTRRNSSLRGSLLHTKDRRRRLRSSGLQRPSRVTYVILIVILIVLLAGTLLYWQVLSSLTEFQNADYLKNKLHHVMENAGKIRNPRTKREKGTLHDDEEAKRREKLVKQDTPSKQELLNAVEPQRPVVQAEVARKQEEAQEPVHSTKKEILLLKTSLEDGPGDGVLRLVLRRDLSNESVDYIYTMVEAGCRHRCRFYRAEKPGILQGYVFTVIKLHAVRSLCRYLNPCVDSHSH